MFLNGEISWYKITYTEYCGSLLSVPATSSIGLLQVNIIHFTLHSMFAMLRRPRTIYINGECGLVNFLQVLIINTGFIIIIWKHGMPND